MSLFRKEKLAEDLNKLVDASSTDITQTNLYFIDTVTNVITHSLYGYIASKNPSLCNWTKLSKSVALLIFNYKIGDDITDALVAILEEYIKE